MAKISLLVFVLFIGLNAFDTVAQEKKEIDKAQIYYYSGYNYYHGEGGARKDINEAIFWFKQSADLGNQYAQYALGFIYSSGIGVEKNYELAFNYYLKSAEQGNQQSQLGVGTMYLNGHGVAVDIQKSIFWLKKSAMQENIDAQFYLGQTYWIKTSDTKSAVYWIKKAKDKGSKEAAKLWEIYEMDKYFE
jgi:TPR repeat protein